MHRPTGGITDIPLIAGDFILIVVWHFKTGATDQATIAHY
jgi:hypothetical protein